MCDLDQFSKSQSHISYIQFYVSITGQDLVGNISVMVTSASDQYLSVITEANIPFAA